MGGIYIIQNILTNKLYVGSTCNISARKSSHKSKLNRGKSNSIALQNAWNKYGQEYFEFIVIKHVNTRGIDKKVLKDYLIEEEQYWINYFTQKLGRRNLYNMCQYASSTLGIKLSENTKLKMSRSHMGKKHTEEDLLKMSMSQRGRKLSDEHKNKIRQSKLDSKLSDETKRRMSIKKLGKKFSDETIRKMSESAYRRYKK